MNLEQLRDQVEELVEDFLADSEEVRPEQLGLESRAGWGLRVHSDYIAVPSSGKKSLEYYGGFEYIDEDYRMVIGDWTFYLSEDGRVQTHLAQYFGYEVDQDEEE